MEFQEVLLGGTDENEMTQTTVRNLTEQVEVKILSSPGRGWTPRVIPFLSVPAKKKIKSKGFPSYDFQGKSEGLLPFVTQRKRESEGSQNLQRTNPRGFSNKSNIPRGLKP